MNLVYKCNECNSTYPSKKGLCIHISRTHNTKDYYDKYLKHPNEGYCTVCGNPTKFSKLSAGYDKTCAPECYKHLDRTKYLHSNAPLRVQWQRDIEDIQATYSRDQLVQYQCKLCNAKVIIKIRKITGLVCIKCKRRWGNLRSFGDENPFQNADIKRKICHCNELKYGHPYYAQTKEFADHYKETCLSKYGSEHWFSTLANRDKTQKTNLLRYGAPYQTMRIDFQRMYTDACLDKYGVRHASQVPEIRRKQAHCKFHAPNGRIYDSSWEYLYEQYLISSGVPYIYQSEITFTWADVDGVEHVYIPDFHLLDGTNRLIEIKGDHFFNDRGEYFNPYDLTPNGYKNAKLKYDCMITAGVQIYTSKNLIQLGIHINGV